MALQGILTKELVPIVLTYIACGLQFTQQSVLILCNKLSLVNAVNKVSKDHKIEVQYSYATPILFVVFN